MVYQTAIAAINPTGPWARKSRGACNRPYNAAALPVKHGRGIFMSAICVLFALAAAQTQAGAQNADATHTAQVVAAQSNPQLKTPITLVAKDANLSEILKVLADRSGMNFVTGEGVYKEKITLILNKTPLDEAINILVRAAGLSYEIIGNSVLIAESDKLKDDVGLTGYVINLKYASAPEVASMLGDISAKVKVDAGGNRLICFSGIRTINEIVKIVEAIDHPHILVMLETRIIEVSVDKGATYGLDWGALSPLSVGAQYPAGRMLDGVSLDEWLRLPANFNFILDVMASNGDAKVLMDSKLTTTNNREATLHIGEVVPYEVQTYNLSGSGGINLQIQKEEVGVKLAVTPHVNEDSQVTLTLEPEVSSIVGWKGQNSDIPLVRVRKTQTTVRSGNGQTIFLAGLIQEEATTEVRKVPLLGDIPLLGYLFQHRKTGVKKTNLIIEITPRIIYDSKEAIAEPVDRSGMIERQNEMRKELK
jgi:type II secretory pathway component GspD/PulD (secretin)